MDKTKMTPGGPLKAPTGTDPNKAGKAAPAGMKVAKGGDTKSVGKAPGKGG